MEFELPLLQGAMQAGLQAETAFTALVHVGGVEAVSATAVVFDLLQSGIGEAAQGVKIVTVIGIDGDADIGGQNVFPLTGDHGARHLPQ